MGIEAGAWPDRTLYPFPTRRVVVEGAAMSFAEVGSGPTVVLAHGTPTWSLEWRHLLPVLAPAHRVLAPDHLGFGLSDRPSDAGYRPEDHARRFGRFLERTVPAGESVSLVLHDFGGPIALDWVLQNTARVRSLVLVNTWMWSWDDDPGMQRKAKLAGGWLGRWRETFPAATVKEFPDAGHWPHEELPTAFALSVQGALGGATRNSTVSNF
jgi:haloalkane dehalogenase